MKIFIYIFSAAFILPACCTVKPLFPKPEPQIIEFDKPPTSVINLPVSVDFSGKIPEIDQNLNEALAIDGSSDDCNLRYGYSVRKVAPLEVSFQSTAGNPIAFATKLGVGAGATYCAVCVNLFGRRCVVPKVTASCGQGGESLRRVQVKLSSVLDVNPDYTMNGNTRLEDLYFIDPCRVTFLNINISGIIESQARSRVPLGAINQRIGSISIRNSAQEFWNRLSSNIQLDDGLFLKIHPEQLSRSAITGAGQIANVTIGLQAKPEITNDVTQPDAIPLPNLQPLSGASGFNIFSDIKLQYSYLSTKLTEAFKDDVIEVLGKKITITRIETFATNNRELIIKVCFKGDICGHVYVMGKPEYDPVSREIKFTNLAYDILTSNLLLNAAAWLLEPIVLQKLQEKAKVQVGTFIDENTAKLDEYLNKEYSNGVITHGKINSISIVPNNFQALPQFFFVRMHATGNLSIELRL